MCNYGRVITSRSATNWATPSSFVEGKMQFTVGVDTEDFGVNQTSAEERSVKSLSVRPAASVELDVHVPTARRGAGAP